MNNVKYFYDDLSVAESVHQDGSDNEDVHLPERVPYVIRDTMEEFAYRTAVWYNPKGEPLMHYRMTLKGIQVRVIDNEDYTRNNIVEQLPLSGEEPRLLG